MATPSWDDIRSPSFEEHANRLICENPPERRAVFGVIPVHGLPGTGSKYQTFRVLLDDGTRRVARIGALPAGDADPEPGFLGTARSIPEGQQYEADIAALLAESGVPALVPESVTAAGGVEIMWLPLLGRAEATAGDWAEALSLMPGERPDWMPVFTDRARTLQALHAMDTADAAGLGGAYDLWLETLFEEATRWCVTHGDPRPGHALGGNGANGGITLIDFSASSWAPAAWDAAGLVTSGLAAQDEAAERFGLAGAEVAAAVRVRRISVAAHSGILLEAGPAPAQDRAAA